MKDQIKLGKQIVGPMYKPFLIADMSANHNGSLKQAYKIIDSAKKFGVDAIKLQSFTPDTMTIDIKKNDFKIKNGLWKGKYLYDLYRKAQTPFIWHKNLFNYARKKNIICFSTPFDETSLELLESLDCPFYKIASFEMTDLLLLKKIAMTRKPIIISTGLANLSEIDKSIKTLKKYGTKHIIILYCVSSYPAKLEEFNLYNLLILKKRYKTIVGLSDHSTNNFIANCSITLGASVIEKHIALPYQKVGLDVPFSMKGKKIKSLRDDINNAWILKGRKKFIRKKSEIENKKFRRSIYCIKDIKKGEKFNINNIKRIRPGYGLPLEYFEKILGKISKTNIKRGNPIKKNNI